MARSRAPRLDEVEAAVRDPDRLDALRRVNLLDTPAEEAFDRLARLSSQVLRAPVALVTLIDEDRQFFKATIGVPEDIRLARQTPLTHSFCRHTMALGSPLVVADARIDSRSYATTRRSGSSA